MSGLQILLSVMDTDDRHYIDMLNIRRSAVVVDQCAEESDITETVNGNECRFIRTKERGLSRSRNMAMSNAAEDIVILCDNDVRYTDTAAEDIETAFMRNPDAGIIVFFIERPERHEPVYDHEKKMDHMHMMKIFSPEIAIRRSFTGGLGFDTDFGAGAKYSMGEENIFLFEAARRGIRIIYEPVKIASLIPNESSWFRGYGQKFFSDRGAGYYAMSEKWWLLLSLQFLIRKRKLYSRDISMTEAWKCMCSGKKEYAVYRGKR